ncbi:MAG: carbohydrate ABC transporter permease [Clostridia bacterium]|nr:carbohydrate ABC transporter permease [Clostridia bacterium]MCD8040881.1 carbohydrate ABC transporter permease [Clostridia bacterium]
MKRKMETSELIFKIIAYVFLIIFAVICVYPFLYALGASFSSNEANTTGSVILLPMIGSDKNSLSIGGTITAYQYLFTGRGSAQFWISYSNTIFMTVIGTVWCLIYSVLGAYALSKKRLLGRHGWNFFLVFTMWFGAGVVATYNNYIDTAEIFATIAGQGGNPNSIDLKWVVVLAMGMNATNIILLRNAFEGVPSEIEEAARIDGATEMQVLTRVYLPMSRATIATVTLFFAISRWNGYFWAMKIMSGAYNQSYSWPVQVFVRDFISTYTSLVGEANEDAMISWNNLYDDGAGGVTISTYGVVYAMVVCSVVPILIVYPFIQKYFAKGVNMGGVKE